MNAEDYWRLFLDTGAPEMYMLYQNARKMEKIHVLENTGVGTQSNTLQ